MKTHGKYPTELDAALDALREDIKVWIPSHKRKMHMVTLAKVTEINLIATCAIRLVVETDLQDQTITWREMIERVTALLEDAEDGGTS